MDTTTPPSELLSLAGRVIIVTGASGNVGSGIVRRLAEVGATVVAHSRSDAPERIESASARIAGDLTAPGVPERIVREAVAAWGRIDGVVNNAGIQPVVPFDRISEAEWTEMIDTNLTATHLLTHAAATAMREQGSGGSVVHISSIEGLQPTVMHGHYATAKAALIMHARAAALAWGAAGVRVNAVLPGLIDRPGLQDDWPDGVSRWLEAVPLARLGTPEDVGDACVFLVSDLSRWITGASLVVDGGMLTRPTW